MRVVELLAKTPSTAKELGASIGIEPNRLYYHLRLLERADIVKVVGAVPAARSAERRYGLVTPTARIDLRESDTAEQQFAVAALLELLRQDFQHLIARAADDIASERTPPHIDFRRSELHLTQEEAKAFSSSFRRLCDRFRRGPDETRDPYSLFLTLLPKETS